MNPNYRYFEIRGVFVSILFMQYSCQSTFINLLNKVLNTKKITDLLKSPNNTFLCSKLILCQENMNFS